MNGARSLLLALLGAVLTAVAAPSVPAQDPIAESRPESRAASRPDLSTFRPPGRTYRMPGADMGQLPREQWISATALRDFAVDLAKRALPNDGGAVWIGFVAMLVVGCAWRPFRFGRNLDCAALLLLAPFYIHLIWRQSQLDDAPEERKGYAIAFAAIYGLTAWWWLRGLAGSRAKAGDADRPGLKGRPLRAVALGLVLLNLAVIGIRRPDDCGHYVNLGAQRMLEQGTWPYGDDALMGGAAATYGPTLYLVNAGILALQPDPTPNAPDVLPDPAFGYVRPPEWAAKATVGLFHLLGLLALYAIGRGLKGADSGWRLVALYAGSPYVLGLGGDDTWVTGIPYVSHIAPPAMLLLAFAALPKPFLSGVLLNLAVATGYFPAFVWPAWTAYFATREKPAWKPFLGGFFLTGAIVIGALWFGTKTDAGENPIALFLEGSIAHQEDPAQYGSSTLSFFGAHPDAKAAIRTPFFGDRARILTPIFLFAGGFSLLGFFLGRRRTPTQLAWLTASTIACVQLWKHHASGTYVEWYYPMLLIGVFCRAPFVATGGSKHEAPPPPPQDAATTDRTPELAAP